MGKKTVKEPQSGAAETEKKIDKKTAAPAEAAVPAPATQPARRATLEKGKIFISASYNNTIITVADAAGNVLAWASAGSLGFAGPKKATPFASSKVVAAITEKLKNNIPNEVEIVVKGIGGGRDSAVRSLINQGFNVISIKDVTAIPHNGPRPRKIRRV